ncbi:MAG: alpha/beta hydrolase [Candidatus Heimdallarchaeota archaeon]|nr:alpha/beta hydrolase [Candidatus Heimdallarchaeota archaeon]MDH5647552.1 alpha/beta hydrolase [Candidatus Heimdallarchaeota archaeon]
MSIQTETIPIEIFNMQSIITTKYTDSLIKIKAVVLFTNGIGMKQSYYRDIAIYFAHQGYLSITFDYLGIGESLENNIKLVETNLQGWINQIDLVIDHLVTNYSTLPLYYIAHSFGGQVFGLLKNKAHITRAVFISTPNGYWRDSKRKLQYFIGWYVIFPYQIIRKGYFPSNKFRLGENIPKNAMKQWIKWCRSKNYLLDDNSLDNIDQYGKYQGKVLEICFTDDEYFNKNAFNLIVNNYGNVVDQRFIQPNEFGLNRVGHNGFYKEKCKGGLWVLVLQWIEA